MNAMVGQLQADPLAVLLPNCTDPLERELRQKLMLARDLASANMARSDGHAAQLNMMIVQTASGWIFAAATVSALEKVVQQCRYLMRCAIGAEDLERST